MTNQDDDERYRDGYAAGRRDGQRPQANEFESHLRSETGDPSTDDGYVDGFFDRRDEMHGPVLSGVGDLLKTLLWWPEIRGVMDRLTGNRFRGPG